MLPGSPLRDSLYDSDRGCDHLRRESGCALQAEEDVKAPLVIVEGFLGGILGPSWWTDVEALINSPFEGPAKTRKRRLLVASIGPVSSLHDRACELYYTLRGGTVDYGEEHSKLHGHARFGRVHDPGMYPSWGWQRRCTTVDECSNNRRIGLHFLGHSIGGPTIVKMQHLMRIRHFGDDAHPDMVLSITSVSAPFRGTQLVYTLGESASEPPAVRPLSAGALLAKVVHLLAYLNPPKTPVAPIAPHRRASWISRLTLLLGSLLPSIPKVIDLHTDARALSYNQISFTEFLKHMWRSDWAESRDATPFDMSFQGAAEREAAGEGEPWSGTLYRSFCYSMTELSIQARNAGSKHHWHAPSPLPWALSPLYFTSRAIGRFDFSLIPPVPMLYEPPAALPPKPGTIMLQPIQDVAFALEKYRDTSLGEACWANDGVVPVFSQYHPFACHPTKCHHHVIHCQEQIAKPPSITTNMILEYGIWHVEPLVTKQSHLFLAFPIHATQEPQAKFWREIGCWLDAVDAKAASYVVGV